MNELSITTAFAFGLSIFFIILGILIVKHYFDKHKL